MRQRIIFVFITFALLFPVISSAAEERIFSNWKYAGETLIANNIVFSYTWLEDVDQIRLRYDSHYKSIDLGDCRVLTEANDTIRACYMKKEYDIAKREFKAYIALYSREPDIEIKRKFNSTDLIIGEIVRVDVSISNNGASAAYDLLYEDNLENFEIIKCENCNIIGNTVTLARKFFDAGKTEELTYYIKPKEKFDRKLAAVLKHNTLMISKEIVTEAVEITADHILGIEAKIVDPDYYARDMDDVLESGKDYTKREGIKGYREVKGSELKKVMTGDSVKMIIELTNNQYNPDDKNPIRINNLEIRIPKNFGDISESSVKAAYNSTKDRIIGSIGFEKATQNIYLWSGWIDSYRKYFVLSMKAQLSGHPGIYISSDFEADNEKYKIENLKKTIEIINISPRVEVAFEKRDPGTRYYIGTEYLKDEYRSEANKREIMKIRVDNPSPKVTLKDVSVVISSDIFQEPLEFNARELDKSGSKLLDTIEFNMPHVSKDRIFPFWINISWRTEFDERFSETIKKKIKIESVKDIDIMHKFSSSSVESGEEFFVTVQLENTRAVPLYNVTVSDDISGFILKSGVHSQKTDIKLKTKIDAYRYSLIAPEVRNRTKKCLNTTVSYIVGLSEYVFSKEDCININPRKIDIRIEKKIESKDIFIGEIFDVDYVITNNDEKSAFGLWFNPALHKDFDLVSNYVPIKASSLDKKESWRIEDRNKVRAKREGNLALSPIVLFYNDTDGNDFNTTGRKRTVRIKTQNINTPMLIISKEVSSSEIMLNQTLDVILSVENIGLGFASNITVWDYGREFNFSDIGTHDTKTVRYNISFYYAGEYSLGEAKMSYSDGIWDYLTASESVLVSVIEEAPEEKEEEITIVEEKKEVEKEKEEPFFKKVIESLLKILFWKREG